MDLLPNITLPAKAKVRWGYIVAFIMLLMSYFLIFLIIRQLSAEMDKVSHSYRVIHTLESIKAEITDAETGVRGYIISGDTRFLRPYNSGSRNVLPLIKNLKQLTVDNSSYYNEVGRLGELTRNRLDNLAGTITSYQLAGFSITNEMRSRREHNKTVMDSIRTVVQNLQEDERRVMDGRNSSLRTVFNGTELITIASLVIALITIFYSLITYTRENRNRKTSDKNALVYSIELEARVQELNKVNIELQELRSIEKFAATGRIARTIAHEVRNPLTNISLAADELKDSVNNDEESRLLLDMIGRNAIRINQMVSDLLSSTRFAQLDFTESNINALLDETIELAKDRIDLNGVQIRKYYSTALHDIPVDRDKLKLAFLNIVVNAIEAMKKGEGVLEITTRQQQERCIIEFSDNGVGMDEDTLLKLFEPYFTDKPRGNGLGLTNSQNIILNHKGSISVKSTPGRGTTFTVILDGSVSV